MALRLQQHPLHHPRAGHRLLPDLQAIPRRTGTVRDRHGWAVRQCRCDRPRGLPYGSPGFTVGHAAARLRIRIPACDCLRAWSRKHNLARLASTVLVWCLSTGVDHRISLVLARDEGVYREKRGSACDWEFDEHVYLGGEGGVEKTLDIAYVSGPVDGWVQFHEPWESGFVPDDATESVWLLGERGHGHAGGRQLGCYDRRDDCGIL